jgi:hypothetical protein
MKNRLWKSKAVGGLSLPKDSAAYLSEDLFASPPTISCGLFNVRPDAFGWGLNPNNNLLLHNDYILYFFVLQLIS